MTQDEFESKYVNTIQCGDCLDVMKDWPDECVDLVRKKDLTNNTKPAKVGTHEESRQVQKSDSGQALEAPQGRDQVVVLRADVVDSPDSDILQHFPNGHEQGNGSVGDSVSGPGASGQVQRQIQGRFSKHPLSPDDRERQMRGLRTNDPVSDPSQEREPSGQPSAESSDSLRELPQQLSQAALVGDSQVICISDPPYGIDASQYKRAGTQYGKSLAVCRDYGMSDWDSHPPSQMCFDEIRRVSTAQIIFGGNYFAHLLPASSCWLVWNKDNSSNAYADCELIWTSFQKAVRLVTWKWHGMLQEPGHPKEERVHPTQKPLGLMSWIIDRYTQPNDIILDPFCGSGTTCVAAKKLGRKYIGIDISSEYCRIARDRLEAVDTGVPVKEARKGQMSLFKG